ncbi:MAG: hypothetical protein KAJ52_08075 [Sedimentisphaerales bacterium]|nr:hypothetical protein [Sedimentisphaerales bacterium]
MDNSRKNHVTVTIIGVFVAFCSSFLIAQVHADPSANPVGDQATQATDELVAVPVSDTASGSAEAASTSAAEPSKPAFEPYLGTITGDNVNIRSGPAEIYYAVGKLHKGQQVVVSGERHGKKNWAMIEPTDQCFSYISKKYVVIQDVSDVPDSSVLQETPPLQETPLSQETSPSATVPAASAIPADSPAGASSEKTAIGDDKLAQPSIAPVEKPAARKFLRGMVTGNFVRVRVGSIKVPPVNARQVQTRLNYGAVVQVIGERDDFYKIVPPSGCYFWTSLDYIRRVGPVTAEAAVSIRSQAAGSVSDKPGNVTLTQVQLERAEYQELVRLFKAEQDKPVLQRELALVKQRLVKLIEDAGTPSVKSLAQGLMRTLARAELARNALKISLSQDERLRVTLDEIDKKVELLVSTRTPAGMKQQENVIQGVLEPSAVFTATNQNRRFLVLGDNDRIVCYAVSDIDGPDLAQWLGKKVSLVGRTRFDAFGKTRILYVTGIIELPSIKNK